MQPQVRMRVRNILASMLVAGLAMATARADVDTRIPFGPGHERYRPRTDRDWVPLASATPTRYGTEYIVVGRDAGWFRTLRIEAVSGRVYVRSVQMTSGRFTRTYQVNTYLDLRHPVVYVDLGGRWLVDQLAVTTRRYPAGAYTVHGSSGTPQRVIRVSER